MKKSISFFIAYRYIFSKNSNSFIAFISKVSKTGLALGTAVLIVVLSVMNGFSRELETRILGLIPHASIQSSNIGFDNWQSFATEIKKNNPHILGIAPMNNLQAIAKGVGNGFSYVNVDGINPDFEDNVSIISQFMTQGSLQSLKKKKFSIIVGELLANNLGIGIGDKINLVIPNPRVSIAGIVPIIKSFTIVGIFKANSEIDLNYLIARIDDIAALKQEPRNFIENLRIKYDNVLKAPFYSNRLFNQLDREYHISNWTNFYGNLFASIKLEKRMIGLLLFLIITVATFNILATLVMIVNDRKKEIAILMTMGATKQTIINIFILQGLLIALIGSIFGLTIGLIFAFNISEIVVFIEKLFGIEFLDARTYFISYLPSEVKVMDLVYIISVGWLLCLISTIYPAYQASKIKPASILRGE